MKSVNQSFFPLIPSELVLQVGQGDREAFSILYDQSSGILFALAVRMLGEQEAADLLQDVYVEIWKKASQYNVDRGSPMAWMVTLTRSRAIDKLRSREWKSRIRSEPLENLPVGGMESDEAGPFESSVQQELKKVVGSALENLPKEQSEALHLAYYEGLSQAEIAVRLQEPVGTIKTRIRLAMYKLRASLQSYWSQE